jgi:hypothetical protein
MLPRRRPATVGLDLTGWLLALAGRHEEDPDYGWDKRFPIDVTGKLMPGRSNTIAARVHNAGLAGGIWKHVRLAVGKA